jgi:hypothetical protein
MVVAMWILCWVWVMGISCWFAQASLVEVVEAQQVRFAGHVYHRCFAHSSPARLLTLAFVPSLSGTILNVHINKYNILHTFSTLHAFCLTEHKDIHIYACS